MSRLETPAQLIDLFGRQLPNPTIDSIRLNSLTPDDPIYASIKDADLSVFASGEVLAAVPPAMENDFKPDAIEARFDQIPNQVIQIEVDTSIHFNTSDGFDPAALAKELFQLQTSTDTTDNESLYINILVAKDAGVISDLKTSKLSLKRNLTPQNELTHDYPELRGWYHGISALGRDAVPTVQRSRATTYYLEMIAGHEFYVISVPFSDYYDRIKWTSTFDSENNPILTLSEIKVPIYIRDFSVLSDLSLFATISIGEPATIGGAAQLSKAAYAMNFGDVVYEDVKKDGQIAVLGDVIYVDKFGTQYSNLALKALNKKYYKIDNFGPSEIAESVKSLLSEYKPQAKHGTDLEDVLDGINLIMIKDKDDPKFIEKLKIAGRLFPEQSGITPTARLYERYRRLILNINSILQQQEEVVKRIYKNYKIVDQRLFANPVFDATSFVAGAVDEDFLYPRVYQTNVANFVPIRTAGADWPGKAEIPFSPSERREAYSARKNELETEIYNKIAVSWRGTMNDGWGDVEEPLRSETGVTAIAGVNDAITKIHDWVFNVWAARFVAESITDKASNFSGMRLYTCDWAPGGGRGCEHGARTCPDGHVAWWSMWWDVWHDRGVASAFGLDPTTHPDPQGPLSDTWTEPQSYYDRTDKQWKSRDVRYSAPIWKWNYGINKRISRGEMFSLCQWLDSSSQLQVYIPKMGAGTPLNPMDSVPEGQFAGGAACWSDLNAYDYLDMHYDYIGAINPLMLGTYAGSDNKWWDAFEMDMYWKMKAFELNNSTGFVGGWLPAACSVWRVNSDPLKRQIATLVMSLLGVQSQDWDYTTQTYTEADWGGSMGPRIYVPPDAGEEVTYVMVGGGSPSAAMRGGVSYIVEDVEHESSDDPEDTSANRFTQVDEYLKDLPAQISATALRHLIEAAEGFPMATLLDSGGREMAAQALTDGLYQRIQEFAEAFIRESPFLQIYIINRLPKNRPAYITYSYDWSEWPGEVGSVSQDQTHYAVSPRLSPAKAYGGHASRIPYGSWVARSIMDSSDSSLYNYQGGTALYAGGGSDGAHGVGSEDGSWDKYLSVNIADGLVEYFMNRVNPNKSAVKGLVLQYLELIAAWEGDSTNTGIHSALSEVDIIVKKYGYYFFDLEKYIRKGCVASEVMNIDRLMAYLPGAKGLTNEAVNLASTTFENLGMSWGHPSNPESLLHSGLVQMRLTMQGTPLLSNLGYDTAEMYFWTTMTAQGENYAYSKVHALQDISFSQITDYSYKETSTSPGAEGDASGETYRGEGTADTGVSIYEVNMAGENGLLDHPDHRPIDLYSNLCMRNYGFPGFVDSALHGTQTRWSNDYRLHCFRYQYFVDDDTAIHNTGFGQMGDFDSFTYKSGDANSPQDKITLSVKLQDKSHQMVTAMADYFRSIYDEFINDYYDLAVEHCAFDDYTFSFNEFFIESMLQKYPTPTEQPWYKMVAIHHILINIFTDQYGGSQASAIESANSALEQVRPETGTLAELETYRILLGRFHEQLQEAANVAHEIWLDRGGSNFKNFTTMFNNTVRVIDHIGDYKSETEALGELFEV